MAFRVGIVGSGGMGNVHARQYRKMPDVELFFYERKAQRAEEFAVRWAAQPCETLSDLLKKVDIVDICLPTDLHHETAVIAMNAGKAVLSEKPVASTVQQARELLELSEKLKVPFMPAQVVRFFGDFQSGHDTVKNGSIGTPAAARVRRGGMAPKGSANWFMDFNRSGGVLLDLAIHDFDWLRWTLGEVKNVYSRSLMVNGYHRGDYALTTLNFESGAIAHVESTWMDPNGFRASYEVAGSKGLVQYDSRNAWALKTAFETAEGGKYTVAEGPLAGTDDPYYKEIRAFLIAVKNSTEVPVKAFDGLMAVSISLAAIESARTGNVVVPESA